MIVLVKSDRFELLFKMFVLVFLILIFGAVIFSSGVFVISPLDVNGNVEVAIQDQYSEIIDLKLSKKIADINITMNTNIDDKFVNISSGVVPIVYNSVCFKENESFYQGNIISVISLGGSNYQIELDKPLDYAFTTLGGCSIRTDNWAVDGSIIPQIFSVSPSSLNNVSWDVTRVIFGCIGDGVGASNDAPDMSSFFTTSIIDNGIVFRVVDGFTKNIFSAYDNFHLGLEAYDVIFYPKNRLGLYAVTTRRSFNGDDKNGVTIRLNSETNDSFELIIQDDLTDMEECHAIAQGHKVIR